MLHEYDIFYAHKITKILYKTSDLTTKHKFLQTSSFALNEIEPSVTKNQESGRKKGGKVERWKVGKGANDGRQKHGKRKDTGLTNPIYACTFYDLNVLFYDLIIYVCAQSLYLHINSHW